MSATSQIVSNVADEIAAGDELGTAQLARKIKSDRNPNGVSPSTVTRWIVRGLPLRNGRRNRLEAVLRGKTFLTSMAAYRRFLSRMTENSTDATPTPEIRTPSQRQRGHEAAMRELAAKGIA